MTVKQNGIEVHCLPDGAACEADESKRNPQDIDICPMGHDECSGDCYYYSEY